MHLVWCEHALLPSGIAHGVTVAIEHGRFTSVASDTTPPPGAPIRRGLTIPGAANAHSHAFHRALRHRSQRDRGSFWTWRQQMYAVAARLDPDRYHRLATAVFAEMVLAGYTAVGEFHYVHHQLDGTPYGDANAMGEALASAALDAGLRITLLDTVYLHGGLGDAGHVTLGEHQRRFGDGDVARWAERVTARRPAEHMRLGAAIHSVRAVDPAAAATVAALADEQRWPLHAHVSEQPAENDQCLAAYGATPTSVLAAAGALGDRFTAVHATHLNDDDIRALGDAGAFVCLCPTTERDLADGIGPARRLGDAGVTLCIGSDSHAIIDPFAEAAAIELDERLDTGVRGVHLADELLATLSAGHRSIGWDDAGTIEPGRRADLVTVRLDSVRTAGAEPDALAEAAVFAAGAADVTDVMVDGCDIVVGGRHTTLDVTAELTHSIAELTGETA